LKVSTQYKAEEEIQKKKHRKQTSQVLQEMQNALCGTKFKGKEEKGENGWGKRGQRPMASAACMGASAADGESAARAHRPKVMEEKLG